MDGAREESTLLHRRARLLSLLQLRPLSTLLSDTKTCSNQFNTFPGLEIGLHSSENGLCDGMPAQVSCPPLTPVCLVPLCFTDLRIWSFPDLRTPANCRRELRNAFHALFFFLSKLFWYYYYWFLVLSR